MTPDHVRAFLGRLNLPCATPVRSQREGVVHAVWLCGELVVRVCKDPDYRDDCLCEAIAHPAAFAAGVRTPEWLHFEADAPEFGSAASVLRRAEGVNLSLAVVPDLQGFYAELARAIRHIHDSGPRDLPGLDAPWLIEGIPMDASELRFVHQDLHADNILVNEGQLSAILDWGDAAIGDPACDLRFVPARFLESALEAYGADASLAHRARLHVADQFAYCQRLGRSYGPNADSAEPEVRALLAAIEGFGV